MRALKITLGCVAAIFLLLAVFIINNNYISVIDEFNYRLTVYFDDHGKPLVRSSVIKVFVRNAIGPAFPDAPLANFAIRGQAIPVRFSNGALIFVLMGVAEARGDMGKFTYRAFPVRPGPHPVFSKLPKVKFKVPPDLLPTMLHFSDLSDPKSARVVDPSDLKKMAGPGVAFINATVNLTDAPVTGGIDNLLPWASSTEMVRWPGKPITFHGLKPDYPYYLERNDW